jgi:predicted transcriptional regulator
MLGAGLNHRQLVQYEEMMKSVEFIQLTDDGMWVATEKGRRFARLYEEMRQCLQPLNS